jgi:hypothetical protein
MATPYITISKYSRARRRRNLKEEKKEGQEKGSPNTLDSPYPFLPPECSSIHEGN